LLAKGHSAIDEEVDQLSAFSSYTPRRAEAKRVKRVLETNWTFAETGVKRLLSAMGLRLPKEGDEAKHFEGALQLGGLGGKVRVEGFWLDSRDLRYVLGSGDGFLGIWDRKHPGPPLETFPETPEGYSALNQRWYELEAAHIQASPPEPEPKEPDPGLLEAQSFPDAVHLTTGSQARLGGKWVDMAKTRYIIGFGQDEAGVFLGVWDRHVRGPSTHKVHISAERLSDPDLWKDEFEATEEVWRGLESAHQTRSLDSAE
jgi:hypothetical protein